MAISIGTQLGSHEVTAVLGKGGMGEVYRARDTKLKREVAIKMLPDEFSRDADRIVRFQREAEALASLNHPNIAGIYDLQEASGSRYLVLELVEGETLEQRIARGAIPVKEALDIAKHICDALEAAHDKGIVHRDLKPANVKITPEGKVKVLDFGLAKMHETDRASANPANSPTLMTAASMPGVIMGTAAYMSPEQAKGRPVDRRTDIFAFGCVLYEMLTGRRTFDGEDITEILGRVVTTDPEWNRLPAETPVAVRRMLQRALKKDSRQRLGDIRDARIEIEEAGTEAPSAVVPKPVRGARIAWIAFAAAVIIAASLALSAVSRMLEKRSPEMRVEITTPYTPAPLHFAISPDARNIVFLASGEGQQRLWLRPLDKIDARPIPGTEGAEYPFWSKDSRSIGFFASGKLYRIGIDGAQPQAIADAPSGRGGAWNADGVIVFAPNATSPLSRVSASGGAPVPVTRLQAAESSHRFPQFLPDGQHFLFYAQASTPDVNGMYLATLDGALPKRLPDADANGVYLNPNYVLYVRQGALVARQLDIAEGKWAGEPIIVADRAGYEPTFNLSGLSISDDGHIAYRANTAGRQQLTWYDRSGKTQGVVGTPDVNFFYPELSPDGREVAIQRTVQNNTDIWLMDIMRGGFSRVTSNSAIDNAPVWSPDGKRIVFSSNRGSHYDLYMAQAQGSVGVEELLNEGAAFKIPQDWSGNGFLLYFQLDQKTGRDLWAMDMNGKDHKSRVVVNTPFEESLAQFSPDGKWIAYQTNESGRFEIVVQAFPEPGGRFHISTNGGIEPRWRADGKELYFIAPDGKMMAAGIAVSGSTLQSDPPVALFQTRIAGGVANLFKSQYAVSRDGRFLINQLADESNATPITLILNWNPKP